MVTYDPRVGNYRGEKGRLVSRASIQILVREDAKRKSLEYEKLANQLLKNKLTVDQFQTKLITSAKGATIYQGLFAIGGKDVYDQSLRKDQFKSIWQSVLNDQIKSLDKYTQAFLNGSISSKQFVHRIKRISDRHITAFYASEKEARKEEGFTQAWRSLNPTVEHCGFCPGYATGGWINLSDVISPGSNCPCSCKCTIRYKK
jgi:hypothetical protein